MSKFTPGPWRVVTDIREWGVAGYDVSAQDETIVGCEGIGPEGKDNARLIAAAPEMYEALKAIVDAKGYICDCGPAPETFVAARAAIAKAEGK